MSVGKRAYDIMRGYVSQEWDRIQGMTRDSAESELNEAVESPFTGRSTDTAKPATPQLPAIDTPERARMVLGVNPGADFGTIQMAYDRLLQRSNPANFPEGSAEAKQAADIQTRVQQAYNLLTANMDTTEKRFRSLEID